MTKAKNQKYKTNPRQSPKIKNPGPSQKLKIQDKSKAKSKNPRQI